MKKVRRSNVYKKWFKGLKDAITRARILARVDRLASGNPGDHHFLGDISELRLKFGPGFRIYYKDTGREIIILLCGGDKTTQQEDIAMARKIAEEFTKQKGD